MLSVVLSLGGSLRCLPEHWEWCVRGRGVIISQPSDRDACVEFDAAHPEVLEMVLQKEGSGRPECQPRPRGTPLG